MFFISVLTIISQLFLFFSDWNNKMSTLYQSEYPYRYEIMPFKKKALLLFMIMLFVIYLFVSSMCIFVLSIIDTNSGSCNDVLKTNDLNCIIICYCALNMFFLRIMSTTVASAFINNKTMFISIYNTINIIEYKPYVVK